MNFEFGTVSAIAIAGMTFSGIISVVVPIVAMIVWMKKTKAKITSFLIGCATFIVFSMILERILHGIVFGTTGTLITGNLILYALYAGLAAGVFEEVGRYLAMKFVMKKNLNKENAVMYGIGHGGIEAILIVGLTMISNVATSIMINTGYLEQSMKLLAAQDNSLAVQAYNQLAPLWTMDGTLFFTSGVERISAIILQIGLSYIVYKSVKGKSILKLFIAILIHTVVDAVTVIINGLGISIWALEAIVFVFSICVASYAIIDYKKNKLDALTEAAEVNAEATEVMPEAENAEAPEAVAEAENAEAESQSEGDENAKN